jgi:hypothetical protein
MALACSGVAANTLAINARLITNAPTTFFTTFIPAIPFTFQLIPVVLY